MPRPPAKAPGQGDRLTTRSLRDDEIRAVADATYRSDSPLRFEACVKPRCSSSA